VQQSGAGELRGRRRFLSPSGITGLGDANSAIVHNQTGAVNYSMLWSHGRHQLQYGGDYKRLEFKRILATESARKFPVYGNGRRQRLRGIPTGCAGCDGDRVR